MKKRDQTVFEVKGNGTVPFYKKLLGIPPYHRNGHEPDTFAETTADGYTVLDTDKLVGSKKFKNLAEQIEAMKLDAISNRNGDSPHTPQEPKKTA